MNYIPMNDEDLITATPGNNLGAMVFGYHENTTNIDAAILRNYNYLYMLRSRTLSDTNLPPPWIEGKWILVYVWIQVHCWRTDHDPPSCWNCKSCAKHKLHKWILRPWRPIPGHVLKP